MSPTVTLILEVAVIIFTARAIGLLFRLIHQPQVIGEMVAGILLGPTLLGWAAPHAFAFLFPASSLANLNTFSMVGIIIYMFLVGMEVNFGQLKTYRRAVILISYVGIVAPFFCGALLALFFYTRLSDDSVSFKSFALFMGAAMSITAFPVLARILMDRNMLGTRLGTMAIACAAVNDVIGWCLLAYVVALVRASTTAMPLWITVCCTIVFLLAMLYVVKPQVQRFYSWYARRGQLGDGATALLLLFILMSALIAEKLGIHLLFGAFLAGAIMPKEPQFVRHILEKFESVTVVLLLPLFFAVTGLRMNPHNFTGGVFWLSAAAVVVFAMSGKLGGSFIAARAVGLSWKDCAGIGILMNTRGLMELVILNIGFDLGVISQSLFSMMVLMAVLTTFMTTPLLEWIYPQRTIRTEVLKTQAAAVGGSRRVASAGSD
jgi:Kef-type K+ transport system membrane component KefB